MLDDPFVTCTSSWKHSPTLPGVCLPGWPQGHESWRPRGAQWSGKRRGRGLYWAWPITDVASRGRGRAWACPRVGVGWRGRGLPGIWRGPRTHKFPGAGELEELEVGWHLLLCLCSPGSYRGAIPNPQRDLRGARAAVHSLARPTPSLVPACRPLAA